jgi:hypothetical protein
MRAHKHEDIDMSSHKNGGILQDHENRITRLEVVVENINQSLIRIERTMEQGFKDVNNRLWTNFFWMVGGFAGVLGLIAHALKWI